MNLENKNEDDRFVLEKIILRTNYFTHMVIKARQYTTSENPIDPNIIAIKVAKDMFSPTESTFYVVMGIMAMKKIRKISHTFLKKDK